MISIATWNVNSLKVRFNQLLDCLTANKLDIVALQETKCVDDNFPTALFAEAGYHVLFKGQKSYNGVALIAKVPIQAYALEHALAYHEQKRLLAASYGDILIINCYIPNGQSLESDKYLFKLNWLRQFKDMVGVLMEKHNRIIVLGDFNIAPEGIDHYSLADEDSHIMASPLERQWFQEFISLGFTDTLRLFNQQEKLYTWWDYRQLAFRRNQGFRIDHILVSQALVPQCLNCQVLKQMRALQQPSDHAPVVLDLALSPPKAF